MCQVDETYVALLGPERKDLLRPPSVHHPSVGRQNVLPIQFGGVYSEGDEAIVVIGVDAKDGVVNVEQRRSLMEITAAG